MSLDLHLDQRSLLDWKLQKIVDEVNETRRLVIELTASVNDTKRQLTFRSRCMTCSQPHCNCTVEALATRILELVIEARLHQLRESD